MKKAKKKARFGDSINNSQVKNYLENPYETLAQNNINVAEALFEGNSNPFYIGLKTLGNVAIQAGSAAGGTGSPFADSLIGGAANLEFALGGTVPGEEVEIEGGEAVELPNGKTQKVEGPNHENGGIDLFLPEGTEVFSKRIKKDGVTMADRKMKRDRKIKKVSKSLDENPLDALLKNTFERTKSNSDNQEENDLLVQQIIGGLAEATNKLQNGTGIGGIKKKGLNDVPPLASTIPTPSINPQKVPVPNQSNQNTGGLSNLFGGSGSTASVGDGIGIAGDIFSTFAPLINTLNNRAKDTPNINFFRDFGQEGIENIQQAQGFVAQQRDNAIDDINLASAGARRSARNTSRSASTQRATDLAIEQQANRSITDVYNNFARQFTQLLTTEAQFQNQQDQVVAQGETARDIADRQDDDNFNTQLAQNLVGVGQGVQQIGKDLNQVQQNDVLLNLVNQLKKYGYTVDARGNVTSN